MFQSLISDLKIQNYTSLKLFVEIESDITMQPSSLINFYHYHDLPERQVSWKGTLKKQKSGEGERWLFICSASSGGQ